MEKWEQSMFQCLLGNSDMTISQKKFVSPFISDKIY